MKNICCSACLLGIACRYDGQSKPNENVIRLKEKFNIIPICPEVDGGLSTPRVPSERVGDEVINKDGVDNTNAFINGAKLAIKKFNDNNCLFAVLKEGSPSCGTHEIYDGTFSGKKISGQGICGEMMAKCGIITYNENEIEEVKNDY